MSYVEEVIAAVTAHEPISPWGLHMFCPSWHDGEGPEGLRKALRSVMQAGWIRMNEEGMLVATSDIPVDPGDEAPPSSQDEGGPGAATSHPTPVPAPPPPLQLVSTDPSMSAPHSLSQTESRTLALRYAIQSGVASLSHLEDALGKFLEAGGRPGGDMVRRAASALLHKAWTARREYEASHKWLQGTLPAYTDEQTPRT